MTDEEIEAAGDAAAGDAAKHHNNQSVQKIQAAGLTFRFVHNWRGDLVPWPNDPGNDDPRCCGCLKKPEELSCYTPYAEDAGMTNAEYVRREEGTYDPHSGWFLCDGCYIRAGQPSGRNGGRWIATPANLMALIGWRE